MAGGTRAVTVAAGGARGEPVAVQAILPSVAYTEHAAALRTFLASVTHDRAAAEDLVHEAFLRLLVELAAERPPAHVRAWLFRVSANLATSRARRRGVATRRAPELVLRDVAPSPEDLVLDREAARAAEAQIAHLPDEVRLALLLSAHGFTGAEIARRIGRTELATRSLLWRHRGRLRISMDAA
jgi:RNA polymerase sigma factor (sigma-70 family)